MEGPSGRTFSECVAISSVSTKYRRLRSTMHRQGTLRASYEPFYACYSEVAEQARTSVKTWTLGCRPLRKTALVRARIHLPPGRCVTYANLDPLSLATVQRSVQSQQTAYSSNTTPTLSIIYEGASYPVTTITNWYARPGRLEAITISSTPSSLHTHWGGGPQA